MEDFFDVMLVPILLLVIFSIITLSIWLYLALTRRKNAKQETLTGLPGAAVGAHATAPSEPNDFIRMRRGPNGNWQIRINGQLYPALIEVPDEASRREYADATRALVLFGREYLQKSPSPQKSAPGTAATPTAPEGPSPTSGGYRMPPPSASAPTPPPPSSGPEPRPSAQGLSNLLQRITDPTGGAGPRPTPSAWEAEPRRSSTQPSLMPVIDLAKEINPIVEELQPRYPGLARRVIRLQNVQGGGVCVVVDGITYPNVDAVPDPEIQALIRTATKEWERR